MRLLLVSAARGSLVSSGRDQILPLYESKVPRDAFQTLGNRHNRTDDFICADRVEDVADLQGSDPKASAAVGSSGTSHWL